MGEFLQSHKDNIQQENLFIVLSLVAGNSYLFRDQNVINKLQDALALND